MKRKHNEDIRTSGIMDTKLAKIAWLSAQDPHQEFHSLMHHINVGSLRSCFEKLDGKKATGVDGIDKERYGQNLQVNLEEVIEQMKRMSYRPGPVRQALIPKEGKPGATRALGVCNFEDKLVQKRVQEILESIYEPIFLNCSYGFRPGRNCHDAIKELRQHLYDEEVETIIDVDLARYFDMIDHRILEDMLRMKIKDTKFLRYINRMFKSGVLTHGELAISEEGVVQGSCASPVLANIYAHYVIDVWLEETVKPLARGMVRGFRYGDDLVICCRYERDALRIKEALTKRLAKYKLKLNEEKTKLVAFSKHKTRQGAKQGVFDFLGFTFYLGKSRKGYLIPKVKTSGKRMRSKLKRVNEWARQVRNKHTLRTIWDTFRAKLRGHVQYFGVSYNSKNVSVFLEQSKRIMFKWLNRRSQRRTFTWEKFELFFKKFPLPPVEVHHRLY
jgi:RNA-directed DNA polymerase